MGISIDNESCLYGLQFDDDHVVYAYVKYDAEYMSTMLKKAYDTLELSINIEKTKYLLEK